MSVQVSYKKQFLLGIMLLAILLVVIEGGVRVYEYFDPGCHYIGRTALSNVSLDVQKEICRDTMHRLTYSEYPILHFYPNQDLSTVHINSFGFRGPEISQIKPDNTFRIFVVGGSTTYGATANSDDTTIPGYLQKKFDDSNLDFKIEIINAGIGSAYSFTENYYIKNTILGFDPDLLIIYDGGNDAYDRHLNSSIKTDENSFLEFVKKTIKMSGYRTPFFILGKIFYQPPDPAPFNEEIKTHVVSEWKNNMSEICEMAKQKGIATLITVQPILGTGNKTLVNEEITLAPNDRFGFGTLEILDELANSLDELDEKCDKTADLRNAYDHVDYPLYYDYIHVNDEGHEIIAQRLFDLALPMILEVNTEK